MFDKAVDASWKNQSPLPNPSASIGKAAQTDTEKAPEGVRDRIWLEMIAFIMTFIVIFRSFASRVTKKIPLQTLPEVDQNITLLTVDATQKEECRPPSPIPPFSEANLLASVIKRLGELEEKVDTLQAKPSEMPYEKDELLNAAVCRVDALEAELIATKKALHEALMRQEELLAYIDRQEEEKYQKKSSCW